MNSFLIIYRSESTSNCRPRYSCVKLTHTTWVATWEAKELYLLIKLIKLILCSESHFY